jgi:two-component sensor histidine kinase
MRRDFIANVSHELKTPLTVVSGFVETMQDMDLDDKQRRRYLQLMQDQSRNMQRLVSDLLTLSALESEQNPLLDMSFAVVPLLLEVSADAKSLSRGEHEIVLHIGDAATLTGNRDELASAFGNLMSNAIRYTPPGGRITIEWSVDPEGSGTFAVTDSGIGIAPEHVPRLTERFYRVDRSRSRATGGTGLGLAIVKHVLLRHQAELEITSQLGAGSTFAVRLPAKRVRHARRRPSSCRATRRTSDSPPAQRGPSAWPPRGIPWVASQCGRIVRSSGPSLRALGTFARRCGHDPIPRHRAHTQAVRPSAAGAGIGAGVAAGTAQSRRVTLRRRVLGRRPRGDGEPVCRTPARARTRWPRTTKSTTRPREKALPRRFAAARWPPIRSRSIRFPPRSATRRTSRTSCARSTRTTSSMECCIVAGARSRS